MKPVRQQINLYQPAKVQAASGSFAAATAVRAGALAAACLLVVWGYSTWRVVRLQRAVGSLEQQHQRQDATISALSAARAAGMTPEQVQAQVAQLSAELAVRTRTLELLKSGAAGQVDGFSTRLAALARRPMPGLWIDHVVLSGMTDAMSVGGTALDPDLVPRYLRGLADERALTGARFDELVIERPPREHAADKAGEHDGEHAGEGGQEAPSRLGAPEQSFRFRAESGVLRAPPAAEKSS
jgi:hypothetical protein